MAGVFLVGSTGLTLSKVEEEAPEKDTAPQAEGTAEVGNNTTNETTVSEPIVENNVSSANDSNVNSNATEPEICSANDTSSVANVTDNVADVGGSNTTTLNGTDLSLGDGESTDPPKQKRDANTTDAEPPANQTLSDAVEGKNESISEGGTNTTSTEPLGDASGVNGTETKLGNETDIASKSNGTDEGEIASPDSPGGSITDDEEEGLTEEEKAEMMRKEKEAKRIMLMMNHKELGYKLGKDEDIIMDASFLISGPGAVCIRLLPHENLTIHLNPMAQSDNEVCRWAPTKSERRSEDYKRFFRRALHVTDYDWIECPSRKSKGCSGDAHCAAGKLNVTRHKPFAKYKDSDEIEKMHHHHKKRRKGGRRNGSTPHEEEESSDEIFEEKDEISGPRVYRIQIANCVRLPIFDGNSPSCMFVNAKIEKGSAAVKQCPKLSAALDLQYDENEVLEEDEEPGGGDSTSSISNGASDAKNESAKSEDKAESDAGGGSASNSTDVDAPVSAGGENATSNATEANADNSRRRRGSNVEGGANVTDTENAPQGTNSSENASDDQKMKATKSDGDDDTQKNNGTGENGAGSNSSSTGDSAFLPGTLEDIPSLKWKHDLVQLLGEIFVKICIPISSESVFNLLKSVSNMLMNEHGPDPMEGKYAHLVQKSNMWDIIQATLHRCSENPETKPLDWEVTTETETGNAKAPNGTSSRRRREVAEKAPATSSGLENSFDLISNVIVREDVANGAVGGGATDSDDDYFHSDTRGIGEIDDGGEEDMLIIQRSPSVFDFNGDDENAMQFMFGEIPRWEFEVREGPRLRRQNPENETNAGDEGANTEGTAETNGESPPTEGGPDQDSKGEENKGAKTEEGEQSKGEKGEDAETDEEPEKDPKQDEEEEEEEDIQLPRIPLPSIQEYYPPQPLANREHDPDDEPPVEDEEHVMRHEDFAVFPEKESIRIRGNDKKEIFFYEDLAEIVYSLSPIIDSFYKILVSSLAYCQKYQKGRGSSVYSLAYNQFEQYFLAPLKDEWKKPRIPQEIKMVVGEFADEDRKMWLDTCMETAFIEGKMLQYRAPRPLYLEDIADEDKGNVETKKMTSNEFTDLPENNGGGAKYFVKEPKMPKGKPQTPGGDSKKARNKTAKLMS